MPATVIARLAYDVGSHVCQWEELLVMDVGDGDKIIFTAWNMGWIVWLAPVGMSVQPGGVLALLEPDISIHRPANVKNETETKPAIGKSDPNYSKNNSIPAPPYPVPSSIKSKGYKMGDTEIKYVERMAGELGVYGSHVMRAALWQFAHLSNSEKREALDQWRRYTPLGGGEGTPPSPISPSPPNQTVSEEKRHD